MRKGIANVLKDYYRLESRAYGGDFDTAVILADLMSAINGDVLTVRQRQYIALYFFCGLTYAEVAHVMRIANQSRVSDALYSALRRLTQAPGASFKDQPADDFSAYDGAVYRWLDAIEDGAPVGEPSREVLLNIAEILRPYDDESAEMIRQRAEGFVYVDEACDGPEYPHYSDAQLRWYDRRMSYVPEVFPEGDAVGSKRVVPKYAVDETGEQDDDEEHITRTIQRTGRRRLFKLRGN